MNNLTFGSLFTGIGGFDLGFERAGMSCKWQVELDDYATRVLEKHWPNVTRFRDIQDCGSHNLEFVDVICGGFPCQDISSAGKQVGLEGSRSGLWFEFHRVVCEVSPQWIVVENVRNLLASNNGQDMGIILRQLAQSGYDAWWDVLPAAAFGAPHLRERVFIVAHTQRDGRSAVDGRVQQTQPEQIQTTPSMRYEFGCTSSIRDAANTYSPRSSFWQSFSGNNGTQQPAIKRSDWWITEPDVGRVADGVPFRVDRLRCLGSAVVPQVAEYIGRQIVACYDE